MVLQAVLTWSRLTKLVGWVDWADMGTDTGTDTVMIAGRRT